MGDNIYAEGTMLLSTALGLNLSQPLLDFVDIDIHQDFPLYIDPIGFMDPKEPFAEDCQADLQDFFQAVLEAIVAGRHAAGESLLAALQEPNETHLGLSTGEPRGRGIGRKQAEQIFANLRSSPAAQTGLLQDLTDCVLFIDGIGPDKISDITTNIIRGNLIEYTHQQFERLGIPIDTILPTGRIWQRGQARWANDRFDRIPLVNDRKILLVPKRYVVWQGFTQQLNAQYYNHFVTNFVRDEQLKTDGHLVRVVKTKKREYREVFKKDIREDMPPTKKNIARFSAENPPVYQRFKAALGRRSPIALRQLMDVEGEEFNEREFDNELCEVLNGLPPGRPQATTYHHLIAGIMTYLFYPHLIRPTLELEINQGRKRVDLSFANASEFGFFSRQRIDPFLLSREVTVECKNYTEDLANEEIDQMIGRFDFRRGRLGMIACRGVDDERTLLERLRDAFRAQQGAILVFTDADFRSLLGGTSFDRSQRLAAMLESKFRALLR